MQRTRRPVVRGAVVAALTTLLAALLLVLAGAVPGATATASPGDAHRVATVGHAHADSAPALVPHSHRAQSLHRLDGTGPALLPDRAGSPRPTYTAGSGGATADRPHARTHGTARGRAPPA
jgi:hypothetical protein